MESIKGKWFLPRNKRRKVAGLLSFTKEEGLNLEIEDKFLKEKDTFLSDIDESEIILGISKEGEYITLYRNFLYSSTWGNSYKASWYSAFAFFGIHAYDVDELVFTKVSVSINNLFLWLNSSGLNIGEHNSLEGIVNFYSKTPSEITFDIDGKVSGKFNFSNKYKYPNTYSSDLEVSQGVVMQIETKEGGVLQYEELWTYVNRFLYWLNIATGFESEVIEASFFHRELYRKDIYNDKFTPVEVKHYFRKNIFRKMPNRPDQFVFDYQKIKVFASTALPKWFALFSDLEVIIQILSQNMSDERPFSEFHFKDVVQALEAFHRKKFSNKRMTKSEYKIYKKGILSQIHDQKDREFVEGRLAHGNEPTLRDRLRELLGIWTNSNIESIIKDNDEFIKLLVENRNYYTHLDSDDKKNILTIHNLYHLSEKALSLLYALILKEVFDDKDFVDNLIGKSRRWRFRVK